MSKKFRAGWCLQSVWLQWTWPDLFDDWTKLLEFEFEWRELNVGNNVKYVTCSKNRIQYLSIKYVFFWALTESWTFPCNQSEINSNLTLWTDRFGTKFRESGRYWKKWTTQEEQLDRIFEKTRTDQCVRVKRRWNFICNKKDRPISFQKTVQYQHSTIRTISNIRPSVTWWSLFLSFAFGFQDRLHSRNIRNHAYAPFDFSNDRPWLRVHSFSQNVQKWLRKF